MIRYKENGEEIWMDKDDVERTQELIIELRHQRTRYLNKLMTIEASIREKEALLSAFQQPPLPPTDNK